MALSLYDACVPSFVQILGSMEGVFAKAQEHCAKTGADANALVGAKLVDDMLPLSFQVTSVAHHSVGAIKGVTAGTFGPPAGGTAYDFAGLRKLLAESRAAVEAVTPAELNAFEGKDVVFAMRDFKIPFTAEGFLLSFSLPNFYFHATTAYDILRGRGVPIGKRDFLGKMRIKT
ncbi:MAG: DUF1993 domain-containing protein [Alphaproteobacteria bacterium]|nr:DUF1993 domain-containing protein [Alphaproteobacteria bacterium]